MKKLISLFIAMIMLAAAIAAALPSYAASVFSDVENGRWSESSISYAVNAGYMNGVGDGKFDPEGSLTRAMVATVLWRREESPAPSAPSGFEDVKGGEWYTDAVAWAKETGVVKGLTETTFGPDEFITREQLATMLFRFSSGAPVSVPERADLEPFSDDEKVSDWANEPLEWAVEAGIINGTDGNRLAPDGFATREQFAAIIERYDGSFILRYNTPVIRSHYTEKEYPLVTDADIYVSTTGSDDNDGSFDRPFRTWERARDAVRALDKTGRSGIKVAFMAGDYGPLDISLTAEDSGTAECPITYCKYGDGDVVFDNGVSFDAGSFEVVSEAEKGMFNEKYADQIRKADLSPLYDLGLSEKDIFLFYSGGLCDKARYPNKYSDNTDHLFAMAETVDETHLLITMNLMHERLLRYDEKCFDTMEIWGYIVRGYRKDTFKIIGYDKDSRLLEVGESSTDEFGGHLRVDEGLWTGVDGEGVEMCYMNVPYELDHEGEYWIDPEAKTLYVYAPDESYFIPGPGTQVTMDHVNDVTFRGLTFKNATGRFISAESCRGITLELCGFSGTAAIEGVYFNGDTENREMDLTVRECTFANSYGHALFVDGNNDDVKKFEQDSNVVFDNNLVRTGNILYDTWNAVHIRDCTHVSVTHNRFEDLSRGAISFTCTTDLVIEYNDFDSAMKNSHDGGVIYTDWIVDARDITVRYNYFGEVPTDGAGQYGLYLDEFSSGFDICSNLFYKTGNCTAMFSLGRDNVFRDNAVIEGSCGWGTSTRTEIEEAGSPAAAEAAGSWGIVFGKRTWGDLFEKLKDPAYRAAVAERWPEMLKIHLNYDDLDDPYHANNPVTYIKNNVYVNRKGTAPSIHRKYELIYTMSENEKAYTYDENPIYVNPTLGDYRIRDGVDFPDIHFELIGRY
ncbi:MAG: S-layer homology domain-containing protein [Clostridia bacterium]|nr:S-layer homology domain-containing protein [Clostridia bacterium]